MLHGRTAVAAFVIATFVLAAGCQKGPRRASVSGEVLVDKVPLVEGSISFFPTDGTEGPEVGDIIKDGKYSIPADRGVIVGKNKVVIRGFKNSGKKIRDIWTKEMVDERVIAVPPEFNEKSDVVRDVIDGKNTFNFDLPGIK